MKLSNDEHHSAFLTLFKSDIDPNDPKDLSAAANAYSQLIGHYISGMHDPLLPQIVGIDVIKLGTALKRFYRDSFGVSRFATWVGAQDPRILDASTKIILIDKLNELSIRINSSEPRKTRIAAAFTLWMTTFKPLCFRETALFSERRRSGLINNDRLVKLDAKLTLLVATDYLKGFGDIVIGSDQDPQDRRVRLHRVWHDFTFRDLTLSSLEFFYMSIYSPK